MGTSTVHEVIIDTTEAIWTNLSKIHMPIPSKTDFIRIATGFFKKHGFPHCLGALDVKHVRIKRPGNSGSDYYNFKKFYSIKLQAVVDSNYKFIFIDVGALGKEHDSLTFKSSDFYKALIEKKLQIPDNMTLPSSNNNVPFVFIADGAYAIAPYLLKPYRRSILMSTEKKIFNQKLSAARSTVEQTFGQISKRFGVFNRTMEQKPCTVINIIKCCCILHNIIIDMCKLDQTFSNNLSESAFVNVNNDNICENQADTEVDGDYVRDEFRKYFTFVLRNSS